MINNISWTSYWCVLIILVIIYYGLILLKYYRSELRNLLSGRSSLLSAGHFQVTRPEPTLKGNNHQDEVLHDSHHSNGDNELLPIVQSLTDEITAYMEQAGHAGAAKGEIINALQHLIKKYPGIKFTPYQEPISNLLKSECENKCSVHLSTEDTRQVWMG